MAPLLIVSGGDGWQPCDGAVPRGWQPCGGDSLVPRRRPRHLDLGPRRGGGELDMLSCKLMINVKKCMPSPESIF